MVHEWIFVKSCYWDNDNYPHSVVNALIVRGAFFEKIENTVFYEEIKKDGRFYLEYQQEHSGRLLSNYLTDKEVDGWTVFSVGTDNNGENITVTLCRPKIN